MKTSPLFMISSQIAFSKIERRPHVKVAVRSLPILLVLLIFGGSNSVKAAIINATNVSLSAVQAAVNSAQPGDTVDVPAGTATWTSTLTINTDIQLIGAGIGQTVVIDGGSPNALQLISYTCSSNHFDRISGFTFQGTANNQPYNGSIFIDGTCHAFRLDHCEFDLLNNYDVWFAGWVYGVVDHCLFYDHNTDGLEIEDDTYGGGANRYGDGSWADQDNWGTTNAMYIEDNIFTNANDPGSPVVDSQAGGRFVFRYNYVTNADIVVHGTESPGRERSARLAEIYGNTFYWNPSANSGSPVPWCFFCRGGTAVMFSNTITGGYQYPIVFAAYREWSNNWKPWGMYNQWDGVSPWDPIDTNNPNFLDSGTASVAGTSSLTDNSKSWKINQWVGWWMANSNAGIASAIYSNNATTAFLVAGANSAGYDYPGGTNLTFAAGQTYLIFSNVATIDMPGRGQGDLMADTVPGNGIPYDTVTGKTNWPNEVSDPIYEWGNSLTMQIPYTSSGNYGVSESVGVIQNRDWFDGIPKPGYTPLPYPHPLDTTNGGSSPQTFTLTVVDGTGGGNYASNSVVSISADTANQTFIYWAGMNIANTNQPNTTVTMPPFSLTVTAFCQPYPPSNLDVAPAP